MLAETTKASRSSQQIQALRIHRDSILPSEPALSPLVPERSEPSISQDALMDFIEWAAFDSDALEARAAKRIIESMATI